MQGQCTPLPIRHSEPRRCEIQILVPAGLGQERRSPTPSPLLPCPTAYADRGGVQGTFKGQVSIYHDLDGSLTSLYWEGLITSTAPRLSPFLVSTSFLISFSLLSQPPSPPSHSLDHTNQDFPTSCFFHLPFFLLTPLLFLSHPDTVRFCYREWSMTL